MSLTKKMQITDLYKEVVDQINQGIAHSCYPAVEKGSSVVDDDMVAERGELDANGASDSTASASYKGNFHIFRFFIVS